MQARRSCKASASAPRRSRGTAEEPWLSLGVGADFDTAFVGNVGGDEVLKDFTALGDVVNTAERLQSQAGPGQLVLSERVYRALGSVSPTRSRSSSR